VGSCHHCLGRAEAALEAAVECPEGAIRPDDRSRRLSESLPSPVVGLERAAANDFPSSDVVVRRQPEPGAEMLLVWELGHISANLCNNGLGERSADTMNSDDVNACNAFEMNAH